jgi:hypothetical protein
MCRCFNFGMAFSNGRYSRFNVFFKLSVADSQGGFVEALDELHGAHERGDIVPCFAA